MPRPSRRVLPLPAARASGSRPMLTVAAVSALALAGSACVGRDRIRPGETLSEVAARHGVSTRALAEANGIADPDLVVAGRRLRIPLPGVAGDPPPPPPPAAPPRGPTRHRVRPGETVLGIAARYGLAPSALAEANAIRRPADLRAGTTIRLPGGAVGGTRHRVAPGETLSEIAARHGTTVDRLASANGIADPRSLPAGARLVVPAGGRPATPAAPPAPAPVPAPAPAPAPAAAPVPPPPLPPPAAPPAPPAPVVPAAGPPPLPARLAAAPERAALLPRFRHWAATYGVDADLLMSLAWLESGWQSDVVSSAGAVGVGQLMPDTVDFLAEVVIGERLDPLDPDANIRMSAAYLGWLLDRTGGDVLRALAGYYQGIGSVEARGPLPESEVYAAAVLAVSQRYF